MHGAQKARLRIPLALRISRSRDGLREPKREPSAYELGAFLVEVDIHGGRDRADRESKVMPVAEAWFTSTRVAAIVALVFLCKPSGGRLSINDEVTASK